MGSRSRARPHHVTGRRQLAAALINAFACLMSDCAFCTSIVTPLNSEFASVFLIVVARASRCEVQDEIWFSMLEYVTSPAALLASASVDFLRTAMLKVPNGAFSCL